MTPLKDTKPPKGTQGNGGESRPKPPPVDDSPWRVEPDGKKVRNTRKLPFENRLNELAATFAGVALLAGDEFTANAISVKAPELSYGWAKLAQSDSRVKRVLEVLFEGSAWAEALIPTVGLVVVVGWHHGYVPSNLGVPLAMANGLVPVSREQELHMRREAEQAAASQSQSQKSEGDSGDN